MSAKLDARRRRGYWLNCKMAAEHSRAHVLIIAAGFGAVLVAWLIPAVGTHPIFMAIIVLGSAAAVKAR